jgi:hypothetical protein
MTSFLAIWLYTYNRSNFSSYILQTLKTEAPCSCETPLSVDKIVRCLSLYLLQTAYIAQSIPQRYTIHPWRWRQNVSPKLWHTPASVHGISVTSFIAICLYNRARNLKLCTSTLKMEAAFSCETSPSARKITQCLSPNLMYPAYIAGSIPQPKQSLKMETEFSAETSVYAW